MARWFSFLSLSTYLKYQSYIYNLFCIHDFQQFYMSKANCKLRKLMNEQFIAYEWPCNTLGMEEQWICGYYKHVPTIERCVKRNRSNCSGAVFL